MPKKKWEKPELIILTRGNPAESLLLVCKGGFGTAGAGGANWTCFAFGAIPTAPLCRICDQIQQS